MRVAVLEFLCGGGLGEQLPRAKTNANDNLFEPLLEEGLQMLSALVNDLVLCEHEVHICLDASAATLEAKKKRLCVSTNLHVHLVGAGWIESWIAIALSCDRTIVIAPELHQQLEHIVSALRVKGANVIASSEQFLQATSDKLATAQLMHAAKVRQPVTQSLCEYLQSTERGGWLEASPLTLKRRDGAGCSEMLYFEDRSILTHSLQSRARVNWMDSDWIVQQWQFGRAASMAIIAGDDWRLIGAVEQNISIDDTQNKFGSQVTYRGGCGPIQSVSSKQLMSLMEQVRDALPWGALGWIGIDFIIPNFHCNENDLVFIEVNPRLTTSYLGYRQWYGHKLAEWIVGNLDFSKLPTTDISTLDRISFGAD